MPNAFPLQAYEHELTNELFAFVTDPNANNRNERAIVSTLHEIAPQMISVAECMLIDGVTERQHVADYVHAVLKGTPSEE